MPTVKLVAIGALVVGALAGTALAQVASPRVQKIDTEFVVPVTAGDGRVVRVGVAGYLDQYNGVCVLVTEHGSIAAMPGACPKR